MSRNRLCTLFKAATAAAGFAGLALAAQTPPSRPLTLEECVSTALGESPVERSAQLSVESYAHAAEAARAPYYPSVGFNLTGSRWQRRIFLPYAFLPPTAPLPTIVGPTDDYALSLNAAYTLFDGGERKAQLAAAQAKKKASEADGGRVTQDLTLSVHQAFFALASALEQEAVARKSLARSEDHLRIARERKAAGAVPLVDVVRAESEVAAARLSLIRAENTVRKNRGALATAMGQPASTPLDIAPAPELPAPPDEAELHAAEASGLSVRPALLVASQGVEAARRGVDLARSAYAPKVGAAASIGHEDASWFPQDKTWYVGVNVSVPIFTGFAHRENLAKAKVDLGKAESDRKQLELSVQEQVWDAYSSVVAAFQAIDAADAQVRSSLESERLARERYAMGAGTITDLLDAELSLSRAEAVKVAAEWEYRAARSQFRWSAGDLDPHARASG